MLARLRMQRQRVGRIRTEPVDHHIEAREISLRQIEDVLLYEVLCRALVLAACKCRHRMSACDELLDDRAACLSICCYNCNFHFPYLRKYFVISLITNEV